MKALFRHFPFHTFIAGILPVSLIIFQNISVIRISYLTAPVIYIIVIALLCYSLAYYILKQQAGAFLYTTFVLATGFYFYGVIQMGIGLLGSKYVRDIYCFGVWLLLCLAVLIAMRKNLSEQAALKFVPRLNLFAATFLFVSITMAYLSYAKAHKAYDPASNNEVKRMKPAPLTNTGKKNVYYILMDECANESTLKRLFDYNSPFNGQLEQLGFFVDRKAFSSYDETFYSMSATLNLEHVDVKNTPSDYYTNNSVNYVYKEMGYQTEVITSYFVKNNGLYKSDMVYDPYDDNIYENEFITSLFKNTAFRVAYKFVFFKKGVNYHEQSLNNSFVIADSLVKT